MRADRQKSILDDYAAYTPRRMPLHDMLFKVVFILIITLFIGFGRYLNGIEPVPVEITERIERIRTQFLIPEQKKAVAPKPAPKKVEKKQAEPKPRDEPVDLTKNPVMHQERDDIRNTAPDEKKAVRRVYGLKRVYSKGLGAGGSLSDAVVGKLGNTLDGAIDTVSATKDDVIQGDLVSTTTVTVAPRFKKRVRPSYTQEMLDNKIEGVVRVKILVDSDGKVKKAIALNDLGFGAKEGAVQACFEMLFEPALRGEEPVAVWIIIPIRFVLLG